MQNAAAIVYGGYVSEHINYSGPDLKPYLWDQDGSGKAVVGYAMISTWMPLHEPVVGWLFRCGRWVRLVR